MDDALTAFGIEVDLTDQRWCTADRPVCPPCKTPSGFITKLASRQYLLDWMTDGRSPTGDAVATRLCELVQRFDRLIADSKHCAALHACRTQPTVPGIREECNPELKGAHVYDRCILPAVIVVNAVFATGLRTRRMFNVTDERGRIDEVAIAKRLKKYSEELKTEHTDESIQTFIKTFYHNSAFIVPLIHVGVMDGTPSDYVAKAESPAELEKRMRRYIKRTKTDVQFCAMFAAFSDLCAALEAARE